MKRSQVTAHLTRWEGKGALYIVAHACFQNKRGKNPSEPYRGEFNPRKALLLALTELRTYEPMCGELIPASIAKMVGVAKFTNQEVTGVFNDVLVTATPKSSAEELVVYWQKEMDCMLLEYRNSPAYQSYLFRRAMEVQAMRQKVHDLMQQLETLDFGNLETVVNWFDELQEASNDVDVISLLTNEEIVQKFQVHGYMPNVNLHEDFNKEDKDNFARYLVGQALNMLIVVGGIHQCYRDFAKDWREKFSASPSETQTV